jgi:hypothetical protein
MRVGYNYPWPGNRYITIGPNLTPRGASQPWRETLAGNLGRLQGVGISIVRIWLMGDGANYDGKAIFGSTAYGSSWEFEPPEQVHTSFLDDFKALLEIFARAKMQMIPVLLDFPFFDDPRADSRFGGGGVLLPQHPGAEDTHGDYIRGRRSVATNSAHTARFVEGTLEPLLKVAESRAEIIYAFEVVNEPFWCISPVTGSLFGRRLDLASMTRFLKTCIERVKAHHLPTTIGHRFFSDIAGRFGEVVVDRPQFHYYALPWPFVDTLPAVGAPGSVKAFLGEFGSMVASEMEELKAELAHATDPTRINELKIWIEKLGMTSRPWPDLYHRDEKPDTVLPERLSLLADRGYELAVIWPSEIETPADDIKLNKTKLASLSAWTGQSLAKTGTR